MLDLQKANMLKRVSAYILDFILLIICITGFALLFSALFGYDGYNKTIDDRKAFFETEYNVSFDISKEEYDGLPEDKKAIFDVAAEAFEKDKEANNAWNMLVSLTFLIISLSILFAHIVTEFTVPMFFGNGQTVGKKVFALGVMRSHHVKITPAQLFVRAILGKCTMEAMVPVLIIIMIFAGILGIVGTGVLFLFVLLQLCILIFTKNNCLIHDVLADTVVVDMSSQMIFATDEELLEYQKKIHMEEAQTSLY